jgi:SPP1 family predicted phage head-tail adaptor
MSAAGKFRERIKVYTPAANVPDGMGGFLVASTSAFPITFPMTFGDEEPEPEIELWADVKVMQAKDVLVNGHIVNKQPFKITIRYTPNVNATCAINWNELDLSINSVVTDARKTEMILTCYANS